MRKYSFQLLTKRRISRILVITFFFVMVSLWLGLHNHATITSEISLGPARMNNFSLILLLNALFGIFAGVVGGTVLVLVNDTIFRKRSFRSTMLITLLVFSLVFLIIGTSTTFILVHYQLPEVHTVSEALEATYFGTFNLSFVSTYLLWGSITLFTLFMLQVNDKFGPGMLRKFLLGQYHHPKQEERIFMFLDMRSSTTIAENLGSKRYFSLLRNVFSDLTKPILESHGEIYQYVGDEIIISWPMELGLKKANCLQCFQLIQKSLLDLKNYYEKEYKVLPEFKAGIHYGKVTAGEIGSIKKDIVYSGDVLNTTSRIQELCKKYNTNLLISEQTLLLDFDS